MITANLNQIGLNEFVGKNDSRQHCKATFPLIGAHGAKDLATVYFEIEPGDTLGRHTDSAEELLVILEGEVEGSVGDKKTNLAAGEILLVPKMVPHDVKNTGSTTVRVLGVFGGANNIVATFDQEMLPIQTNIVDTSQIPQ